MEFDDNFNLENPFDDDDMTSFPSLLLFHTETAHMPSNTYLQTFLLHDADHRSSSTLISIGRRRILSLIQYYYSLKNFDDSFSCYLAINYMDRFLSTSHYSIPLDGKQWILHLVAVSCLSLALKMRNIEFSISDFQAVDSLGHGPSLRCSGTVSSAPSMFQEFYLQL
ncbi:putative cyclin-D6-1 [Sesamum alatum]|uniref:Cyclin-D6-1 n=1 Tax=Sesamum alatum TaxID=300844 RepID=A0AAE1XYL4_9LAMI|nr:putative cyclin-D6-1 [Sesamum alatum]